MIKVVNETLGYTRTGKHVDSDVVMQKIEYAEKLIEDLKDSWNPYDALMDNETSAALIYDAAVNFETDIVNAIEYFEEALQEAMVKGKPAVADDEF